MPKRDPSMSLQQVFLNVKHHVRRLVVFCFRQDLCFRRWLDYIVVKVCPDTGMKDIRRIMAAFRLRSVVIYHYRYEMVIKRK